MSFKVCLQVGKKLVRQELDSMKPTILIEILLLNLYSFSHFAECRCQGVDIFSPNTEGGKKYHFENKSMSQHQYPTMGTQRIYTTDLVSKSRGDNANEIA